MKVSVLQWNVWFREKADNILKLLRQVDADIICLQELTNYSRTNSDRNIPDEIANLGYNPFYIETLRRPDYHMGNGLFSKFPLQQTRNIYVQRGKLHNPDHNKENRVYLEADMDINGKLLKAGTTHLSFSPGFSYSPPKEKEADKLIEALRPNTHSFIFTGDLNALPDSLTVAKLDSFLKSAGPDYTVSTWTTKPHHFADFSAESLNWRLDYAYTTPDIKVLSSKTIDTDYSDHLPILVEIEI